MNVRFKNTWILLKNYYSRFSLSSIAKETEIGSHVTVREYLEMIDFYVGNTAIEVKWQNKIRKKNLAKIDVKNKILLSKDEFELGDINIIPVSIFLLL